MEDREKIYNDVVANIQRSISMSSRNIFELENLPLIKEFEAKIENLKNKQINVISSNSDKEQIVKEIEKITLEKVKTKEEYNQKLAKQYNIKNMDEIKNYRNDYNELVSMYEKLFSAYNEKKTKLQKMNSETNNKEQSDLKQIEIKLSEKEQETIVKEMENLNNGLKKFSKMINDSLQIPEKDDEKKEIENSTPVQEKEPEKENGNSEAKSNENKEEAVSIPVANLNENGRKEPKSITEAPKNLKDDVSKASKAGGPAVLALVGIAATAILMVTNPALLSMVLAGGLIKAGYDFNKGKKL